MTGLTTAFIVLMALGIGAKIYKNEKEKKRAQYFLAMEQAALNRSIEVVEQSIERVNNSNNPETRKVSLECAIKTLESMIRSYPEMEHFPNELEKMKNFRPTLHTSLVEEKVEKIMARARTMKTVTGQIGQASKALYEIEIGLKEEFTDKNKLLEIQQIVNKFISDVQLGNMKLKAEKYAMKSQYAKAADVCMDALFHLKNDNVDDSLQTEEFENLASRLREFKEKAAEASQNKKRKNPASSTAEK